MVNLAFALRRRARSVALALRDGLSGNYPPVRLLEQVRAGKAEARHWKQRWREAACGLRRRVPSPAVLRDLIPARAEAARQRALLPESQDRHRRQLANAAYRAAVTEAAAHAPPGVDTVEICGLHWSFPVRPGSRTSADRVSAQGLPLRAILQGREVATGGTMLDIGANIGRTSIPRAVLGDAQVVYAAEPEPGNYRCLVRNIVSNGLAGLVLPEQIAIGSEDGEVPLVQSKYIGGHAVRPAAAEGPQTVRVRCRTLDRWVADLGVARESLTFVKVDVQGWEAHVLQGATGLLAARHVAWQLEVDPPLLDEAGSSLGDLLALIERHFTHAIDFNRLASGDRVIETRRLAGTLAYLGDGRAHKTDLVLYHTGRDPGGLGR
jgi:FkbM family methyltransferase